MFICMCIKHLHCWGAPTTTTTFFVYAHPPFYFQKWELTAQAVLHLTSETYCYILQIIFYQHMEMGLVCAKAPGIPLYRQIHYHTSTHTSILPSHSAESTQDHQSLLVAVSGGGCFLVFQSWKHQHPLATPPLSCSWLPRCCIHMVFILHLSLFLGSSLCSTSGLGLASSSPPLNLIQARGFKYHLFADDA